MTSMCPIRQSQFPIYPRPYSGAHDEWTTWLVHDQRFVDGRPDVLTWETPVLTEPVRVAGRPSFT